MEAEHEINHRLRGSGSGKKQSRVLRSARSVELSRRKYTMIHRTGTIGAFLRIVVIMVLCLGRAGPETGWRRGRSADSALSKRSGREPLLRQLELHHRKHIQTRTTCQQRVHDPLRSLQRPRPSALRRLRRMANALLPTTMQCTKICVQRSSCA